MATANELFKMEFGEEPHMVINSDRSITVPPELVNLAMQFDHGVENVTFDCPRYWDIYDLSELDMYIKYEHPKVAIPGAQKVKVTLDETDSDIIHFTWNIRRPVTEVSGPIEFQIHAQRTNDDGTVEQCWHSQVCTECVILESIICRLGEDEVIVPDNFDLSDLVYCFDSDSDEYVPVPGTEVSFRYDEETGNLYYVVN